MDRPQVVGLSLWMLVPSCEKFKSAQSSSVQQFTASIAPTKANKKKKSTLLRIATLPSASSAPLGADSHLKRKRGSWLVVSCSRCILACDCPFWGLFLLSIPSRLCLFSFFCFLIHFLSLVGLPVSLPLASIGTSSAAIVSIHPDVISF
jgi:hypothetical protein